MFDKSEQGFTWDPMHQIYRMDSTWPEQAQVRTECSCGKVLAEVHAENITQEDVDDYYAEHKEDA